MSDIERQSRGAMDMTRGSPTRRILLFSLPLLVGNIFQQLYNMVDSVVVGQFVGSSALTAVSTGFPIIYLLSSLFIGFSMGATIMIAQYIGAGDRETAGRTVDTIYSALLAVIVPLTVLGVVVSGPLLTLIRVPPEAFDQARVYCMVVLGGIIGSLGYNLNAGILQGLGDSKTPLIFLAVACGINVVLDLIFVLVFHWGIAGAASATVIAQVCSGVFCLAAILRLPILTFSKEDFRMEGRLCLHLMKLGLPMAFQNAIISVGGMIVQFVVNGFGVLFIAGFTATNKLYGILEVAAISYGYAMVTYSGQNLGAKKMDRISKGMRAALVVAVITSAVIAAVMLIFGRTILGWFISGNPEDVAATLDIAYHYLFLMAVFLVVLYMLYVFRSAIQGLGNTVVPMASGIVEFFMRVGAALLLPLFIGQNGIFYAEISAWTGAAVLLAASYFWLIRKYS